MAKCISLDAVRDNCDRAHVLPDCLCTEIMVEDMHIDAGISSACMYAHVMHTFLSLFRALCGHHHISHAFMAVKPLVSTFNLKSSPSTRSVVVSTLRKLAGFGLQFQMQVSLRAL